MDPGPTGAPPPARRDALSLALAGWSSVVAASAAATALTGVLGSLLLALLGAALTAAAVAWLVARRGAIPFERRAASRGVAVVAALAMTLSLIQLARLAVFMIAPERVAFSMLPSSAWQAAHSCLTAYFVAGEAAQSGRDVYDPALYELPRQSPEARRVPRILAGFNVDEYEYPPPFLLLPRALGRVAHDFVELRMLWHGLTIAVLLLMAAQLGRFLGPVHGTRMLLLFPLVLASFPTLIGLQMGNAQLMVIALSVLAMLLVERKRYVSAGCLLAYVTLSKLFPGMLLIYLLVRREWRALGWTAAAATALLGASLLDTGLAPYFNFIDELPGLLGGESFPPLRNPTAIALNLSIPGLVFKLSLLGVPGMGFPAAKLVGWLWTAIAIAATVVLARRTLEPRDLPLAWVAILILATLRSPFLPHGYGTFPVFLLLVLLAARLAPSAKSFALLLLAWLGLNVLIPMDVGVAPPLAAVLNSVPQLLTLALAGIASVRLGREELSDSTALPVLSAGGAR